MTQADSFAVKLLRALRLALYEENYIANDYNDAAWIISQNILRRAEQHLQRKFHKRGNV